MRKLIPVLGLSLFAFAAPSAAQTVPTDGPALGSDRITQADIESGNFTMRQLRKKGMQVFSTPFNKFDGFGDGPENPNDPVSFGGRPTIQSGNGAAAVGNGTWLRVNGLDSQTCLECHSVLSNRTLPASFAVGGIGGIAASAFPGPDTFDVGDTQANGFAAFNGRTINPPFVFGSGGVELLAKEMTVDLQDAKAFAEANPNTVVSLDTKGVNFGTISHDGVDFDTSNVEGVDPDTLVVAPFGRRGDNQTIRVFDTGAMQFHHGMQPQEVFGVDVDSDGDGVANEVLPGELSAIHIFSVNLARPREVRRNASADRGFDEFASVGCADCHTPRLDTETTRLPLAFPEVHTDPWANTYLEVDLRGAARFRSNHQGGVKVQLYSDLKRHVMADSMGDPTGAPDSHVFITARLWGIADTAPYMNDGRALTLRDAIMAHGGEGQAAADNFAALSGSQQDDLLNFLGTLRVPRFPNFDIDGGFFGIEEEEGPDRRRRGRQ